MKYCQLIIIWIFLFHTNLFSIEWEYIGGPSCGMTFDIEKDSKGNIYVASINGIWKSTDKGDSWIQVYNHVVFIKDKLNEKENKNLTSISICSSIAIDSKDRIYAVNWPSVLEGYLSNIILSENGGDSWKDITGDWLDVPSTQRPCPNNIELDDYDNAYVSLVRLHRLTAIQRTSNQGLIWEAINRNEEFINESFLDFKIKKNKIFIHISHPTKPLYILLYIKGINDTLWKKFETYYCITGIEQISHKELMIGTCTYIFKTTDDGVSWFVPDSNLYSIRDIFFISENEIYVKTYNDLYITTDKGNTFTQIFPDYDKRLDYPMQKKVIVDKMNNYYSLGGTGITKSTDKGKTWYNSSNNFTAPYIYYMSTDKEDNLLVGTIGAYRYNKSKNSWNNLSFLSGFIKSVYYAPDDNIYLSGDFYNERKNKFFRSTDNGETFQRFCHIVEDSVIDCFYDMRMLKSGLLLGGSEFGVINYSTDKGETWDYQWTPSGSSAIGVNKKGHVFISNFLHQIARSTDGGWTWEAVYDTSMFGVGFMTSIEFHPHGPIGYAVSDGYTKVKTTDYGKTWFPPMSEMIDPSNYNNIIAPSNDIAVDSLYNFIVVGYNGIWRTTTLGYKWERIDSGMQHIKFNRVEVSPSGYIYVAAEYGGVYRSKQRFVAVQELTPSTSSSPLQNYPNPFTYTTEITYTIPEDSFVHLSIYDILGIEVQELVSDWQSAGTHKIKYDGANLPSGIYFIKLEAGGFVQFNKMCHTL